MMYTKLTKISLFFTIFILLIGIFSISVIAPHSQVLTESSGGGGGSSSGSGSSGGSSSGSGSSGGSSSGSGSSGGSSSGSGSSGGSSSGSGSSGGSSSGSGSSGGSSSSTTTSQSSSTTSYSDWTKPKPAPKLTSPPKTPPSSTGGGTNQNNACTTVPSLCDPATTGSNAGLGGGGCNPAFSNCTTSTVTNSFQTSKGSCIETTSGNGCYEYNGSGCGGSTPGESSGSSGGGGKGNKFTPDIILAIGSNSGFTIGCNNSTDDDDEDPPPIDDDPPPIDPNYCSKDSQCGGSCTNSGVCISQTRLQSITTCPDCVSGSCSTKVTNNIVNCGDSKTAVESANWTSCLNETTRQGTQKVSQQGCFSNACGTQIVTQNVTELCPLGTICNLGQCIAENNPPTANATATPIEGEPALQISFNGSLSSDPEGGPLTYIWDFGDSQTIEGSDSQPKHTYQSKGTYQAFLTVRDKEGLESNPLAIAPPLVVNTLPKINFEIIPTEGIPPVDVSFVNKSSDKDSDNLTYTWDFDGGNNGQTSTEENPQNISFNLTRTYNVTLTVDDGTSSASLTKSFVTQETQGVKHLYATSVILDKDIGLANTTIYFQCLSPNTDTVIFSFTDLDGNPIDSRDDIVTDCMTGQVTASDFTKTGIYQLAMQVNSTEGLTCKNCPAVVHFVIAEGYSSVVPDNNPLLIFATLTIVLGILFRK